MKFLHTADWQIGMGFAMLGNKGERVRMARLESARKVADCARRERVDFVVVAGDTFDDNGVERLKIRETAKILASCGCPVYVIPGNHDRVMAGSVWEDAAWKEWPGLHVLVTTEPVEAPGATLYPCPVSAIDSHDDPVAWIDGRGERIAIGIAHGSVESPAYGKPVLPIARDAAERHGLDYLALGHFHSKAVYPGADGAIRIAYSGTHEPTAFTESASGNVLVVEIAERGAPPEIQTIRTGCLDWRPYRRKIERAGEIAALVADLDDLPAPEQVLVECILEGVLYGTDHEALSRLLDIVEARFLFGRADVTRLRPDESGPGWMDKLPEGYVRDAAQVLLAAAGGDAPEPAAMAALQEFSRIWQEVGQ
jgi:hypothetical protein